MGLPGISVFPLLLTSLSNFEICFAFIIQEILTGQKKKEQGIFLRVHRKKLAKEKKKKCMGQKCVSIALDFPLEFRDFFCIHYSGNTKGHEIKNQGMFLNVHRKILVKKNNISKPCKWEIKNTREVPEVPWFWCRTSSPFSLRFSPLEILART